MVRLGGESHAAGYDGSSVASAPHETPPCRCAFAGLRRGVTRLRKETAAHQTRLSGQAAGGAVVSIRVERGGKGGGTIWLRSREAGGAGWRKGHRRNRQS